jgi:hypothetical protein
MTSMRARLAAALVACGAAIGVFGAAAVWADSAATNGGATSVRNASAVLNGTVHTTDPDSAWLFQYGTSTAYGHVTPLKLVGAGVFAVSAQLNGLTPGRTYHFRLIVSQGSYPTITSYSADAAFTTSGGGGGGGGGGSHPRFGHSSLLTRSLKVHGGTVAITFKCAGASGAACKGTTSLSAAGKLGRTTKTYGCGSAKFNTTAGKRATARIHLSANCRTLLNRARNHKLGATLKTTFSTHQPQLKLPVTLLG